MKKLIGACAIVLVLSLGILGCGAPKEGDPAATTATSETGTGKNSAPTSTADATPPPTTGTTAPTGK